MKQMNQAENINREKRSGYAATFKSTSILLLIFLLISLGESHLNAIHVGASAKTPAGISKDAVAVGPFGEIVRGPRGRSEIALTFDAGAEAECFDDLIAALEKAGVRSIFLSPETGRRNIAIARRQLLNMGMKLAITPGTISTSLGKTIRSYARKFPGPKQSLPN